MWPDWAILERPFYTFSFKSSPIPVELFWGYLKFFTIYVKTTVSTFWATFLKNWATSNSTIWSLWFWSKSVLSVRMVLFLVNINHIQITLTYFIRGNITVQPTSCLTALYTAVLLCQHYQQIYLLGWIQTSKTGGRPHSEGNWVFSTMFNQNIWWEIFATRNITLQLNATLCAL